MACYLHGISPRSCLVASRFLCSRGRDFLFFTVQQLHPCLLWKLWSWLSTEILYYRRSGTMHFPIVCLHNFWLYGPFLLFSLTWRWTKQSQVLFLLILLFDNGPRFKTKLKTVNMIRAQFLFFALWFIQIMPYLCSFLSFYLFFAKKVWDLT